MLKIVSVIMITPGNNAPAVVKCLRVKSVMPVFTAPRTNALGVSDSGARQDLRYVGKAAMKSAEAKATSATVAWLTKAQNTRPPRDTTPQTMSVASIFQTA